MESWGRKKTQAASRAALAGKGGLQLKAGAEGSCQTQCCLPLQGETEAAPH